MSSSDSEDDCYGNVAKTLQNLKSKYQGDKVRSANLLENTLEIIEPMSETVSTSVCNTNLFEDSLEIIEPVSKTVSTSVRSTNLLEDSLVIIEPVSKTVPNSKIGVVSALDNIISDDEELNLIIATHSKRATRSSAKNKSTKKTTPDKNNKTTNNSNNNRSRRGRKSNVGTLPTTDISNSRTSSTGSNRRGRGRPRNVPDCFPDYPTISIGNTYEYPDLSNNIQLFNNAKKPDVVVEDIFDENEELSVKVYWQSSEIVKFNIRKFQKLSQIFEFFSNKASVSIDKLFFTYNDVVLKPDDTPETIDYNIAKFIDGGVVKQSISNLAPKTTKNVPNGIKLKFQYPNSKKPFEICVLKEDLFSSAMIRCAEHMDMPLQSLKFEFDGDYITGKETPKDLDMEGGECIDVKIIG